MNTRLNIALRLAAVCVGMANCATMSLAADYYFGTFDDALASPPTYPLISSYSDPNSNGWSDFGGLVTSANVSTTIGVTTGTQSLAWQPGGVGYYQGLTYKLQTDQRPTTDRAATLAAMLANTHLAFNVTWDRNEWVTQHNGDINSSNYSLVQLIINYGPGGTFSNQGAPDIDSGNSNFKGGWDPVNYTTPTHTRVVEWDYTDIKPQIQALVNSGALSGTAGFLEFILVTNAGSYNYPITYYLDSYRFTTPGVAGDFNNDGKVDAGDYATWRKNEAANATLPNDNGAGTQAARYALWRANFGNPSGAGSSLSDGAVPEPGTALLALVATGLIGLSRGKK